MEDAQVLSKEISSLGHEVHTVEQDGDYRLQLPTLSTEEASSLVPRVDMGVDEDDLGFTFVF